MLYVHTVIFFYFFNSKHWAGEQWHVAWRPSLMPCNLTVTCRHSVCCEIQSNTNTFWSSEDIWTGPSRLCAIQSWVNQTTSIHVCTCTAPCSSCALDKLDEWRHKQIYSIIVLVYETLNKACDKPYTAICLLKNCMFNFFSSYQNPSSLPGYYQV